MVEFDRECLSRVDNRQPACGPRSDKADIYVSGGGLHVVARLPHFIERQRPRGIRHGQLDHCHPKSVA